VKKGSISVTQLKSHAGQIQKVKATLRGLKLGRIRKTAVLEDTPCIRGMIRKVSHLVQFQEVEQK